MKECSHSDSPSALFISGNPSGIGHIFRVEHSVEALNSSGWKALWCTPDNPELIQLLKNSDLVVLFRLKWNVTFETIHRICAHRRIPLVYDIDDLIFEPELMIPEVFAYLETLPYKNRLQWHENSKLIREALKHCDAALLTTKPLAEAASRYCKKVFVFPNTLNLSMEKQATDALKQEKPSASDKRLRIGFASGTPTHQRDFAQAAQALARILKTSKDIQFVIVGELELSQFPDLLSFRDQIETRPRVPLEKLLIEFARFDISLAPLEVGNPFCEAKSELRYIFASSVAVPSVVSPTNPLQATVVDNQTGLLASNQDEWETAITYLINNPDIRISMGAMARLNIQKYFGWKRKLDLAANIFPSLIKSVMKPFHNKIKNIYLHIGLHKTGTTTIQDNLLLNRNILYKKGYLYPEFRIGNDPVSNHSIPIYSMFCNDPENYHINIMNGNTSPDLISILHKDYYEQLTGQIYNFEDGNLIISGEDISKLSLSQLSGLKEFLISITNPGVKIVVIGVIRHPVNWITSLSQQLTKQGIADLGNLEKVVLYAESLLQILNHAQVVFGEENVKCCRFEDLETGEEGFIGEFLKLVNMNRDDIHALPNDKKILNSSLSYESVILFDNLFRKYPRFVNRQLNSLYSVMQIDELFKIPGVKFHLSEKEKQRVWKFLGNKMNLFCRQYGLKTYEYRQTPEAYDAAKWDLPAIKSLTVLLPTLKKEIAVEIINTVLYELKKYKHVFTWSKKLKIFTFAMYYSAYFEARSRRRKLLYLIQFTGIWQLIVLSVLYKTNQKKLINSTLTD